MNSLDLMKSDLDQSTKSANKYLALGSSLSVGAVVLGLASVLAPLAATTAATIGASFVVVGGLQRLVPEGERSLTQEKVGQLLSLGNPSLAKKTQRWEDIFEKATDNLEDSFMKVSLSALGASLLSVALPLASVALATYGIYKSCDLVQSHRDRRQSMKIIASLHRQEVLPPQTVSPLPKPKF